MSSEAIKTEAQAAEVTFEFRGETFTLPPSLNEADGDVLEFYEDDKPISALKALLGADQFARYKRVLRPKVKDHVEFIEAAFAALGTSSGE